jgi:hypothetical protein
MPQNSRIPTTSSDPESTATNLTNLRRSDLEERGIDIRAIREDLIPVTCGGRAGGYWDDEPVDRD